MYFLDTQYPSMYTMLNASVVLTSVTALSING
jgi:hypothetical protein